MHTTQRKVIGFDYTSTVSEFFRVCGISDVFLMPPNYGQTVGHKILHSIIFFLKLPHFIKKYDTFVFLSAPYFHFLSLAILKAAKKNVLTVVIELYGEMALEKTWQGPLYKRVLRRLLFPVYELMELISIKLSNAVFCVSWYSTEKYKKLHLNRNVFRVYNGANVAKISRIKPKRFRKKTIFYMGGFPRWKGVDLLLRAFEIVKKKHPETQLVVMGGCDEEVKYDPELGRLLSKKEGVVWIRYSPHEEAISNLKGAYIAVMPARDAFMTRVISSLKVFEHIAAEIPQVCTDTGEHAEWVRKLDVGIVVKDTPEDIAKGILRLLEDKKLYKRLKENCRKRKWEVDNEIMKKPLIEYLKKLRK